MIMKMICPTTVLLSLLLLCLHPITAWNIALETTTQINGCIGGEVCTIQPVITVNNKQGELQLSFEGRVTVEIDTLSLSSSATINDSRYYEPVWKEDETVVPTAYDESTFISQNVINGQAIFTGLGINTATDEGYQLRYVLYDEHELIMDTVIGHVFTVGIGERYQLEIVSQPEMAYGGSVFGSQPVLAVHDRGGNVVTDVNEGMVCYFCFA